MTIRKGKNWGTSGTAPTNFPTVKTDSQLAQLPKGTVCALTGGDLHQSLGSPALVVAGAPCTQLDLDAIAVNVVLENETQQNYIAASRVEINQFRPRRLFPTRYVCITNGGIVDGRNITPRAHPNDGILDLMVINKTMTLRQRIGALSKARTGTHIPHPDIDIQRRETFTLRREAMTEHLRIDGCLIQNWISVDIAVLPDYWKILV
jgi:hypothetical protein